MANNDDPGGQLKIHQQINDLLKERHNLLLDQVDVLSAQARVAKEVCGAIDCENLEGMEERLTNVSEGLGGVKERTEEMNEALEEGAGHAEELSTNMSAVQKAALAGGVAGFIGGLKSGFSGVVSIVKNVFSGVTALIKVLWKVGSTIISIPFKILGGLVDLAQQNAGSGNALAEAYENVREKFGDIASNEGKAIVGSLKTLRSSVDGVAGSGLAMSRVFGYGSEGMAKFLGEVSELAEAAGPSFDLFKGEVEKNGAALIMYKKGLGLTNEQLAKVGAQAVNSGSTMTKAMNEFANAAINAGDAHGMSSKVIGKAMGEMVADFDTFGNMAPDVMANVAVYTRKLGIEVKALNGMVDKFDNFEDAAKSAARLAQSFGMNVDAMKMMREQNPAKRLQMLQRSFKASGKSVEVVLGVLTATAVVAC